jgi:branched-chain amino acid transport system ATP-binding protein
MLGVEGLSRRFGGIYAVREVRLHVEQGELRGVLGPNGAGKSTLFHLIAGHLHPDGGSVRLRGESIDRLGPAQRAEAGIAIVYQNDRIFRGMTLRENVMVGAHCRAHHGFFAAALRTPRFRREERELASIADAVLDEVGLGGLADRVADALPLGQQRSLQLARALAASPSVLLLDEPASGLRAVERQRFAATIQKLRARGVAILLIEHDVGLVTSLADRITVLDLGTVIAEGTPAEIRADPAVIAAYLGGSEETLD